MVFLVFANLWYLSSSRAAILCSAVCISDDTRSPKERKRVHTRTITMILTYFLSSFPLLYNWFSPLPNVHSQLFPLFWTLLSSVVCALFNNLSHSLAFGLFSVPLNGALALVFQHKMAALLTNDTAWLFWLAEADWKWDSSGKRMVEPHKRDLVGLKPSHVALNVENLTIWILCCAWKIKIFRCFP